MNLTLHCGQLRHPCTQILKCNNTVRARACIYMYVYMIEIQKWREDMMAINIRILNKHEEILILWYFCDP